MFWRFSLIEFIIEQWYLKPITLVHLIDVLVLITIDCLTLKSTSKLK